MFITIQMHLGRTSTVSKNSLYTDLRKEYLTEWRIWYRMHQVVNNKIKTYVDVQVWEGWHGPEGFIEWFDHMGPRPSDDMCLSRIDKFGDFEPGNIEWTTYPGRWDTARWHSSDSAKWQAIRKQNGINKATYYTRLKYGWHPKDAATIPPNRHKRYKDYLV